MRYECYNCKKRALVAFGNQYLSVCLAHDWNTLEGGPHILSVIDEAQAFECTMRVPYEKMTYHFPFLVYGGSLMLSTNTLELVGGEQEEDNNATD